MSELNGIYNGRFQFCLYMNDNIVCQRFFDVGENLQKEAFNSVNLQKCMKSCVKLIQEDLADKTRQYLEITSKRKLKLSGFITDEEAQDPTNLLLSLDENIVGEVTLTNGRKIWKEYMETDYELKDSKDEKSELRVVLKFGDTILYDSIRLENTHLDSVKTPRTLDWDGNQYPRLVRNNINLSNESPFYDNSKELLNINNYILHNLTKGRSNLINIILYKISNVLSNKVDKNGNKYVQPGKFVNAKKAYDKMVDNYRNATADKWHAYQNRWR